MARRKKRKKTSTVRKKTTRRKTTKRTKKQTNKALKVMRLVSRRKKNRKHWLSGVVKRADHLVGT